jgi:hypothetical protein
VGHPGGDNIVNIRKRNTMREEGAPAPNEKARHLEGKSDPKKAILR